MKMHRFGVDAPRISHILYDFAVFISNTER